MITHRMIFCRAEGGKDNNAVILFIQSESSFLYSRYYNHSNNDGGYSSYETCDLYVPGVGWRPEPYTLNTWKSDNTGWTLKNGSVLLLGNDLDDNVTELVTPGVGSVPGFYFNNMVRLGAIKIHMDEFIPTIPPTTTTTLTFLSW